MDRLCQGQGLWHPVGSHGDRIEPGALGNRQFNRSPRPGSHRPIKERAARLIRGESIQPQTTTHPLIGLCTAETSTGPFSYPPILGGPRGVRHTSRCSLGLHSESLWKVQGFSRAPDNCGPFSLDFNTLVVGVKNRPDGSAGRIPTPGSCDRSPENEPLQRVSHDEA